MTPAAQRRGVRSQRGSGGRGRAPEPRYLAVGEVIGVHGLRGEVKVKILTHDPHRFRLLRQVYIGLGDDEPVSRRLEHYRLHKGMALLKLEGLDDRTSAEALRDYLVLVPVAEALPLEEGEFYEHQILGLAVWTAGGEHLGEVVEILYTGANDVYVVRGTTPQQPEFLLPAIAGTVRQVDLEAGRLIVDLPEGLL